MRIHRAGIWMLSGMAVSAPWLGADAPLREPTPAEAKALNRIVTAISTVFDSFASPDWRKTSDWYDGKLLCTAKPDRPIDVNTAFDRTYEVPEKSQRFQTLLMPLLQRAASAPDMQARIEAGDRVVRLQTVKVWAYLNRRAIEVPAQQRKLEVPGAAAVFQVDQTEPFCDARIGHCYLLCFGDWKAARWRGDVADFAFTHPPGTPYVENVVIRINGAEDRIQELFRTVNWNLLNEGLTL